MQSKRSYDPFAKPVPRPEHGDAGFADRWSSYLNGSGWDKKSSPFKIPVRDLIKQAELKVHWDESEGRLPLKPRNTVTDFCGWLYSFYSRPPLLSQLENGRKVEIEVDTCFIRTYLNVYLERNWEIVFRDTFDANTKPLRIDSLRIGNSALWGKPDIVFRHTKTGSVIIVERKASQQTQPSDSWPNVRAQLWCYSKADIFQDAPRIMLVAEAWRQSPNGAIAPNGVVTWDSTDNLLNSSMQELFEIYKAQF